MQTDSSLDHALRAAFLHSYQRSKIWLLVLPVLFGVGSYLATYTLQERWSASGVVQAGTVGNVTGGPRQHIESLPRSIERLRLRPFQDLMLRELGLPTDELNPVASLFRRTLSPRQIPGTDLIEISIQAHSKAQARQWLALVVGRLQRIHTEISEPHVRQLNARFKSLKSDIQRAVEERRRIMDLIVARQSPPLPADGLSPTLAVVAMLHGMEINTLERTLALIEEQLGPLYTRPTTLMFEIQTVDAAVFPNRPRAALLGALLGLIAALCIILARGLHAAARA